MSATARKRREELAQALRKLIQSKGKTPALKYQQLFDDLRAQSETVSFFIFTLISKSMVFFQISIFVLKPHYGGRETLSFSADIMRKPVLLQINELNLCCIVVYSGF